MTAVEALVATGVTTMIDSGDGYTPTPVISCAILGYNRSHTHVLADGLVITPSHNPPTDGGLKCNPPHGGPTDAATTGLIERIANDLLASGLAGVCQPVDETATSWLAPTSAPFHSATWIPPARHLPCPTCRIGRRHDRHFLFNADPAIERRFTTECIPFVFRGSTANFHRELNCSTLNRSCAPGPAHL